MRRLLFAIVIGLGGAAILIALGVWQVQRLAWKQSVITEIEARIVADPVALPAEPDPVRDAYLPVEMIGEMGQDDLLVLVSQKRIGAGYRVISTLRSADRTVLVDRGFVPVAQADQVVTPEGSVKVIGNLQWPQEVDKFTPAPEADTNIAFARDVPYFANRLETEPVMVVVRSVSPADPIVTPLPVDTSRIPNDHLNYAITWFSLAAIWLAMSFYFLRRRAASDPLRPSGPTES